MSQNVAQKVACFGVTTAPGLSEVAYTLTLIHTHTFTLNSVDPEGGHDGML